MGNFELRSMPTMARKDCGQLPGSPSGDNDQS
jgi:hypothetical protein